MARTSYRMRGKGLGLSPATASLLLLPLCHNVEVIFAVAMLLCARECAMQRPPCRPLACHAMSLPLVLETCQGNTFQFLGCPNLSGIAGTLMDLLQL